MRDCGAHRDYGWDVDRPGTLEITCPRAFGLPVEGANHNDVDAARDRAVAWRGMSKNMRWLQSDGSPLDGFLPDAFGIDARAIVGDFDGHLSPFVQSVKRQHYLGGLAESTRRLASSMP